MISLLDNDFALQGYTGPGTNFANEMKFVMNHVPGAGSIVRPVDQQSSALPLYQGCSRITVREMTISMTDCTLIT